MYSVIMIKDRLPFRTDTPTPKKKKPEAWNWKENDETNYPFLPDFAMGKTDGSHYYST